MRSDQQLFIFNLLKGVKSFTELMNILTSTPQIMETFSEFSKDVKQKILEESPIFNYHTFNNETIFLNFVDYQMSRGCRLPGFKAVTRKNSTGALHFYGDMCTTKLLISSKIKNFNEDPEPFENSKFALDFSFEYYFHLFRLSEYERERSSLFEKFHVQTPKIPSDRKITFEELCDILKDQSETAEYYKSITIKRTPHLGMFLRHEASFDYDLTVELLKLVHFPDFLVVLDYLCHFNLGIDFSHPAFKNFIQVDKKENKKNFTRARKPFSLIAGMHLFGFVRKSVSDVKYLKSDRHVSSYLEHFINKSIKHYDFDCLFFIFNSGYYFDISRIVDFLFKRVAVISSWDVFDLLSRLGFGHELSQVILNINYMGKKDWAVQEIYSTLNGTEVENKRVSRFLKFFDRIDFSKKTWEPEKLEYITIEVKTRKFEKRNYGVKSFSSKDNIPLKSGEYKIYFTEDEYVILNSHQIQKSNLIKEMFDGYDGEIENFSLNCRNSEITEDEYLNGFFLWANLMCDGLTGYNFDTNDLINAFMFCVYTSSNEISDKIVRLICSNMNSHDDTASYFNKGKKFINFPNLKINYSP